MQIVFVPEDRHWITTHLKNGEVLIYDSNFSGKLTPTVERCLVDLYKDCVTEDGLLVTVPPFQQQTTGSVNCGVFAIAAAFHAAEGNFKFRRTCLDEALMRDHLSDCFELGVMASFPTSQDRARRNAVQNILIPVNCTCRRADSVDDMIQCDKCDSWYHFKCVNVATPPVGSWICDSCL